jgi:hypothetical protein
LEEELEIEYKPFRKLIILESIELPQKELFERLASALASEQQPITLNWAEGIVFIPTHLDHQSDRLMDDLLKGTVYWSSVFFARMPTYQTFAKIGALELPIIDQSRSLFMRQAAKWLRKRSGEK